MAVNIKEGDLVEFYSGADFFAGEVTEVGMFSSPALEIGRKAVVFVKYTFNLETMKFEQMEESKWFSVERSFSGLTHVTQSWINKK